MLISVKTLSFEKMGEIHHVIKKLGVPFALTNLSLSRPLSNRNGKQLISYTFIYYARSGRLSNRDEVL